MSLVTSGRLTQAQPTEGTAPIESASGAAEFCFDLIESSEDCINLLDLEGRLEFMNRNGQRLLEISDFDGFKGMIWSALWPEAHQEEVRAAVDAARKGGKSRFTAFCPTANGVSRWWDVTVYPVHNGSGMLRKIASVSRDITQFVESQAEISAARTRAEVAMRQAEAGAKSTTAFLANMSHEIRTPLNGVLAIADVLAGSEMGPRERDMVQIIRSSGETLERLLADLLDLARIEAGGLSLERRPYHLAEVVRAAVAVSSLKAKDRDLEIRLLVDPEAERLVEGDGVRLKQIVTNLVGNAVKFTERGHVAITVEPRGWGDYRVTVSDTGPGFDPAQKDRLFRRFEQADGTISRRFGGSGLGLPISRLLAQMMGGELECLSEPGVGSTFWVDLPLTPLGPAIAQGPADEGPKAERTLRVLVADDHATNRKVIELILKASGATLEMAEDGREAVEKFKAGGFDLVLMDMQMPLMDGLTATREIRRFELERRLSRTPIFMLTANAFPEHAVSSAEAGADRHLTKPISPAVLMAALANQPLLAKAS